ncbi:MAG: serine--tRNA ligase [Alphaproteobacteria bacterium]|nr:serine--tRNA ligase [Alphaproteobacteria bacterium]
MHDIRFIRENPDAFYAGLRRRGYVSPGLTGYGDAAEDILDLDTERRKKQTLMQELQAQRNDLSKQVGEIKRKGNNADALMQEVTAIKDKIATLENEEQQVALQLNQILSSLPNLAADNVPDGVDEKGNKELRRSGEPKRTNSAKQHFDLGEALGYMDFATATKLSGARFTLLKGPLARLERALGNFMLDIHTKEFGYTEVSPPLLVREEIMYGTGQLPKFRDDQFQTNTGLWLIPTAEVPLTNFVNDMIIERETLPFRFTAKTPCFRAEAGAAGKDTRGMLRQHQFYKVELVSITTPDQSEQEHDRMTACAEAVLKKLELPFRTMVLCAGDMGFAARKTYDIEVWMPGQNAYREISSCSNCGDFQARRMNARSKAAGDKNTEFVHTLNGSGIAVGRALIAIMENFQQPDGSIVIPTALQPYMDGMKQIEAGAKP